MVPNLCWLKDNDGQDDDRETALLEPYQVSITYRNQCWSWVIKRNGFFVWGGSADTLVAAKKIAATALSYHLDPNLETRPQSGNALNS